MAQASRDPRRPPTSPGRLPRRVYVRRRIVVLVLPVLVIGLVVWWFAGRGQAAGSAPGPQPTGTVRPSADPTASTGAPTPAPTLSAVERAAAAAGVAVCGPDDLDVELEASAPSYAGADRPTFRIVWTNTLDEACLLEAGDANRRVSVSSGDDLVWSSTHCMGAEPASRPLLLGPGTPSEETYTWARVRSTKGCGAVERPPGAGTYTAKLRIGGELVAKAVFDLR